LTPNEHYVVTVESLPDETAAPASTPHPLDEIAKLATDMGVTDLARRHSWYAHGYSHERDSDGQ
jgi:hypothetical protein